MIFGCQSSILHTRVDIHINIKAGISIQGHSTIDVRKTCISTNGYSCLYGHVFNYQLFYGCPFGYPLISMDILAWTCYGF